MPMMMKAFTCFMYLLAKRHIYCKKDGLIEDTLGSS